MDTPVAICHNSFAMGDNGSSAAVTIGPAAGDPPKGREATLRRLRERFARVPAEISLSNELISERRIEAFRPAAARGTGNLDQGATP